MNTVMPRNSAGTESMTQDNMQKMPTQMAGVDNYAGNESGVSTTAGYDTTAGQSAPFQAATYINIDSSEENRAAQFKYPSKSQEVPTSGRNQYQ
jgi:hypothetical protein